MTKLLVRTTTKADFGFKQMTVGAAKKLTVRTCTKFIHEHIQFPLTN